MFGSIIFLGTKLTEQTKLLKALENELNECRKESFERFEVAVALSDICDKFQSSKNAKNKYICQKK